MLVKENEETKMFNLIGLNLKLKLCLAAGRAGTCKLTATCNTVFMVPHSVRYQNLPSQRKLDICIWLKSDTRHGPTVFRYKGVGVMAADLSEKVEAVSSMLKKYSMKSLLEAVLSSFPAIPFTKPTLLKR